MKKSTFKVVFNRLKKLNKDKKALIQIESYLNGKRKYLSTGIRIEPKYWNEKTKRVKNNHPDYIKLNRLINQQLKNIEDFEFKQIEKNGKFELQELNNLNKKNQFDTGDFITFCKDTLSKNTTAKPNTISQHSSVIRKLESYKKRISFNEMNYNFIKEYDDYLRNSGLQQNSIANQHKTIKAYVNLAIKNRLISAEEYPYRWFKIRKIATKRTFLTLDEINKIENLKFTEETKHIEKIRDMFVFSCYCGLRFSDVQNLTNRDIIKDKNGYSIEIRQSKTEGLITLPISLIFNGKAVNIVEKYYEDFPQKYLFPRATNATANNSLKIIALVAKIDKKLTFHVSRHSFGTNLASATSDQFLIKELMGHAKIETSMIYIHTSKEQIRNKLKNTNWG